MTSEGIIYAARVRSRCDVLRKGRKTLCGKTLVNTMIDEVVRITAVSVAEDDTLRNIPHDSPVTQFQYLCMSRFKRWARTKYPNTSFNRPWLDTLNNYISEMIELSIRSPKNKIYMKHVTTPLSQDDTHFVPHKNLKNTVPSDFESTPVLAGEPIESIEGERNHYIVNYTVQFGRALLQCETKFFTAKTVPAIERWLESAWDRCSSIVGTPKPSSLIIDYVKIDGLKEKIIYSRGDKDNI